VSARRALVASDRLFNPWNKLGDFRVDARKASPSTPVASRDDPHEQPSLISTVVVDERTSRVVLRNIRIIILTFYRLAVETGNIALYKYFNTCAKY